MRDSARCNVRALVSALLLVPLAASLAATAPLAAQVPPVEKRPAVVFEAYLSRARLDPSVVGTPTRLEGVGGRLLVPLAAFDAGGFARRLSVGGFVAHAPDDDDRLSAVHYGATTDVRLLDRPIAGTFDPLFSLGVGAFRVRRAVESGLFSSPACLRPNDFVVIPRRPECSPYAALRKPTVAETDFALSPAVGTRIALLPGVALRLDLRDIVIYRGAPRHNFELATGVSITL